MQIKPMALSQQLQKKTYALYLLIGQDSYLLENSSSSIKTFIKQASPCDEKILSIKSVDDWQLLIQEANTYSLFAPMVLILAFYDKKTLSIAEKKALMNYLGSINTRCKIIIQAPNLPIKQLQSLAGHEEVLIVVNQALDSNSMQQWIGSQFKNRSLAFEPEVPQLIHQYTEGNMLACAQFIEKIALSLEDNARIRVQEVLEQVSNQCDYSPFELVEYCLLGQADKALQIIRHSAANKTEPSLILWVLTQELRVLLQLHTQQKTTDFKSACSQLKIWPQRMKWYQISLKRHQREGLSKLMHFCRIIDERIKSNANGQVWNALESLAIGLSTGQLIGLML